MADISKVKIGSTTYDIKARKVVGALSIGGKSFDGSAAVSVTSSDLGIKNYTAGDGIMISGNEISIDPGAGPIQDLQVQIGTLQSLINGLVDANLILYPQ